MYNVTRNYASRSGGCKYENEMARGWFVRLKLLRAVFEKCSGLVAMTEERNQVRGSDVN